FDRAEKMLGQLPHRFQWHACSPSSARQSIGDDDFVAGLQAVQIGVLGTNHSSSVQEDNVVPYAAAFVEKVQGQRRITSRQVAQYRTDRVTLRGENALPAHHGSW